MAARLGRELVRLHQDARRPHRLAAPQARRRRRRRRATAHGPRRRLPVRRARGRRARAGGVVSLRVRLVLALAYVLLLAIVALEVPLGLEHPPARRRRGALAGARPGRRLAATAADLLAPGAPRRAPGARDDTGATVRGRVIVVDAPGPAAGRQRRAPALAGDVLRPAARDRAPRCGGHTDQRTRHSSTLGARISSPPRCPSAAPPGRRRWARCGSPRAWPRCTAPSGARSSGSRSSARSSSPSGSSPALVIARTIARPDARPGRGRAPRGRRATSSARAAIEGSTEQRALARTFNEMTGRVARLLRSQQDFVADASHQLRTPLTGLRLRLEEARAPGRLAAGAIAELDAGMTEVDRLAQILEELLVLSRAGERELPGTDGRPGRCRRARRRALGARRPPSAGSASTPTSRRPAAPGARRRTSTACSTCSSRTRCATRPPGSAVRLVAGARPRRGARRRARARPGRGGGGVRALPPRARGPRAARPGTGLGLADRPRAGGRVGRHRRARGAHRRRRTRRRALRARRRPRAAAPAPEPEPAR